MRHLTRRKALLLPLILAACGDDEPVFQPLRYDYLPPILLNVASIETQQLFVPSGVSPDVTAQDPVAPVEALKTMGHDRLKAFGVSGKAVFAILDASLTKRGDTINASMAVSLTVYGPDGSKAGFAEARVQHTQTGYSDGLHSALYNLTKTMMDDMNVEFEYQIRQHLRDWLTSEEAPATPVQQAPLDQSPPNPAGLSPAPSSPTPPGPTPPSPTPLSPAPSGQPQDAPPTLLSPPPTYLVPPSRTAP